MLQYLDTSIVNAFRQIVGGFGFIFVLAFLMWTMSQRRRGIGGGWLGNTYYYLVAPGVMFHELGHYFIRDDTAQSEFWNAETQANRFAAALLVPREMLLKDVGEKRENLSAGELCMLREKYGVSISALLSRMESLGIISNALKTKWNTQYPEPGRKDTVREREEPRMVRKLVYRSVAEGYISERKGKELLIEGFFGSSPEEADA
mgnify:CR=1 FL=1